MARTRTTVVLLVVASLALILWDLRASDQSVRAAAQQVVSPMQRTVTAVFSPFGDWARQVGEFDDPTVRAQQAAAINAPAGWRTATGRVVAADIAGDRAAVTIDVGRDEGVTTGNAVLALGGLVGQVSQVAKHSATVLLVTDPASTMGVRVLPSKEIGVVQGAGMDADLQVALLSPAAAATVDDAVVSLGSTDRNGVPPDLPVGAVSRMDPSAPASGRSAAARPVAGMTSLETLLVLTERS